VEIITEEPVLKWYREAHSPKGKMHFLEKMRPFIEWLQNAEEGKRCESCELSAFSRANLVIRLINFV
jgi:hypothetical protein